MFVKVVPNDKRIPGTSYLYLVESYRKDGKIRHKTLRSFGLFTNDQVPFIQAAFADPKPRLVWDDEL